MWRQDAELSCGEIMMHVLVVKGLEVSTNETDVTTCYFDGV